MLYVHDSIQSTVCISECHQNINYLSANLYKLKFNIAVIYKIPTVSNNTFHEYMATKLMSNKKTIIIGDTNTNILNNYNNTYMQIIETNGYNIVIK